MSHCLAENPRERLRPIVGRNRPQVRETIAYSDSLLDGDVSLLTANAKELLNQPILALKPPLKPRCIITMSVLLLL
jgi:hypothetical protein